MKRKCAVLFSRGGCGMKPDSNCVHVSFYGARWPTSNCYTRCMSLSWCHAHACLQFPAVCKYRGSGSYIVGRCVLRPVIMNNRIRKNSGNTVPVASTPGRWSPASTVDTTAGCAAAVVAAAAAAAAASTAALSCACQWWFTAPRASPPALILVGSSRDNRIKTEVVNTVSLSRFAVYTRTRNASD